MLGWNRADVMILQSGNQRVVVAMSGGVDSSVAALLLQREGYDVVGVTMKLYSLDEKELPPDHQGCCTLDDVEDARSVCRKLGIPHYVLNMEREFQANVMDYFISEYRQGRTPHPCIACNDKIKFSRLMDRADALSAGFVATGHYARVQWSGDGYVLRKAVDHFKDQSYVLFGMTQAQLSRTLMPVGDFPKEDIRRLALEARLVTADKPDSQDICFVVRLEPENNRVVIGPEHALYTSEMLVSKVNYTSGTPPQFPASVGIKTRYKAFQAEALLRPFGGGALVKFREPQRSVTPGQAAVFYQGDVVLGGGTIERTNRSTGQPADTGMADYSPAEQPAGLPATG